MSNMDMENSEIAELLANIHEQECESAALEEMQHQLQVGLEEDEKFIVGKLAILRKQLHDESERAKNMECNINSLWIKQQKLQEQEHLIDLVIIIFFIVTVNSSYFELLWCILIVLLIDYYMYFYIYVGHIIC